jgi:putative addiction module component (TIGR02574 family)
LRNRFANIGKMAGQKGVTMTTADVIEQALNLKASDRYLLLEMLHRSLDKPDPEIDKVWQEEALRRVKAFDEGRLATVSMEEVFRDL